MIIKEANEADFYKMAELEKQIFKDPWPLEYFLNDVNNEVAKWFVMLDGDMVIGYGGLWLMFENVDLVNIAVAKDYQGMGLGEELLSFLVKKAISFECEYMHLEVRVSNFKAINLYKKLGFEQMRVRHGYYEDGEDCIDMVKGLI